MSREWLSAPRSMRRSSRTAERWWLARTRLSWRSIARVKVPSSAEAAAGAAGSSVSSAHASPKDARRSGRSALFKEGRNAVDQVGAVGPVPRVLDAVDPCIRQLRGVLLPEARRDVRIARAPNYQRRHAQG